MRRPGGRQIKAGLAALGVFLVLLVGLKLRSAFPFVAAGVTYLALLWVWRDRPARQRKVALPDGVVRADYDHAVAALDRAGRELRTLGGAAPAGDAPRIRRMADLVEAIRRHHQANPSHVGRTRIFVRHTLERMVAAVAGYVDLARRAGPDSEERLAEVSRRIEGFVPVLQRIDQACIDNDLMALEISVEVLDEQLGRDRDV